MINLDNVIKEETKEHNPNWPQLPDHPNRILIIGGSESGKPISLFNQISHQPDIDKIYLYAKDPCKAKCQFLIDKQESTSIKHFNDSKPFLNTRMIWTIFIKTLKNTTQIFDDMIADILSNKKLNPIVTELFIRGRKLNISLVFITKFYFAVPKNIRLNSTHYFIIKIRDKCEL